MFTTRRLPFPLDLPLAQGLMYAWRRSSHVMPGTARPSPKPSALEFKRRASRQFHRRRPRSGLSLYYRRALGRDGRRPFRKDGSSVTRHASFVRTTPVTRLLMR